MDGRGGSSSHNRRGVDDNDWHRAREKGNRGQNGPAQRKPIIYGGPPLTDRPHYTSVTAGPSRTATSIRAAQENPTRNSTRLHNRGRESRARTPPPPVATSALAGYRVARRTPLTQAALYNDEARPPVLATSKPHHVCTICWDIKSHPVSYICGHSHCYVCIRLWLERQWRCPDCTQVIHMAPFRHYGEEKSITYDYPFWIDDSRVSYSFHGLVFPPAPVPLIVLDIDDSP
ncbi:hypothetical protein B0H14DRAFT_3448338 [Mycena olivaceomarginata]|nr:hypothetical protein B0H14DRAFT_3448338 [Mycena olivaceomarginata]